MGSLKLCACLAWYTILTMEALSGGLIRAKVRGITRSVPAFLIARKKRAAHAHLFA